MIASYNDINGRPCHSRPNLLLANFTKVWLPASGAATAQVTIRAEELGYYDGWAGVQTVDTGEPHGVYDLFVCKDSTCTCGGGKQAECLAKVSHATLRIHG